VYHTCCFAPEFRCACLARGPTARYNRESLRWALWKCGNKTEGERFGCRRVGALDPACLPGWFGGAGDDTEVLVPVLQRAGIPRNMFGSEGRGKFLSTAGINFGLISD
jgi:hypothetical protein